MSERTENERQYSWIVNVVAVVTVGALAGYVLSTMGSRPAPAEPPTAPSTPATAAPAAPVVDESELRAYRDILARDPKNVQAAVKAGNMLYDAQRYLEAIPFYRQAFSLNPSDINVSTDLGTALWYSGRPQEALAQYARSLALNPTHPQTLVNVGIVRAEGTHDYAGAVAAWEKLLAANPDFQDASHVRSLLADARQKIGAPAKQ